MNASFWTTIRRRSAVIGFAVLSIAVVIALLGVNHAIDDVQRESEKRCAATNQLRVGITEGLLKIAHEQPDPEKFIRASQPILDKTKPIDCAHP